MNTSSRVFVAGARGLVGSAIVRQLRRSGYSNLLVPSRSEVDLSDVDQVERFFDETRPEVVFHAAAKVGGIVANDRYPAEFIHQNLLLQTHVIDAAWRHGAARFVFLGSSCIYPKHAPQPMREEHLLTGPLEPTNRAYAIAKLAGIEMVDAYRRQYGFPGFSLLPTNIYGPGDNFDLESSHVAAALIRKFHEAKESGHPEVVLWGSGTPRREFLHVDDLADAAVFLAATDHHETVINVGCGEDLTIDELAETIKDVVGYSGRVVHDREKPDGTPRKLLDVSRLFGLGWRPRVELRQGLAETYTWYRSSVASRTD